MSAVAVEWYDVAMLTTIDAAGRIVVPKAMREELGFGPGAQLDVQAIDGRLEIRRPSVVRLERGPHGLRAQAPSGTPPLTADDVRELIDRGRR
jgi:AbrB family looped-hinge helix DNA binding protein